MDKYYTPKTEELFVSYECEMYTHRFLEGYGWNKQKLDVKLLAAIVSHPNDLEKRMRVKFLDKEDIINEGWKELNSNSLDFKRHGFEKGNYFLLFYPDKQIEIIMKDVTLDNYICHTSNHRVFTGKLKSINEFRKIIEWTYQ